MAALRASGLCHPDDQARLTAFIATLTAQPGATAQVTTRLRHQAGTWRWIEQRGQNHTDTPALAGLIVSVRDVTERVLAEQAARAAAERLNILAAASPALAAINHREPEEHLGQSPQEILPGLAPRLEPIMRQVLETGEAVRDQELHGQFCAAIGGRTTG